MKTKKFVTILIGISTFHIVVLALFIIIGSGGGCKNPEVLANRTYIPAPAPAPSTLPQLQPEENVGISPSPVEPIATPPAIEPEKEKIPALPAVEVSTLKYTVKKGDCLWKIARRYGVSIKELATYNRISEKDILKVGVVLNIPPGGELLSDAELAKIKKSYKRKHRKASKKKRVSTNRARKYSVAAAVPQNGAVYIVKKGDSLWKIAIAHHLRVSALAEANNIDIKKPLYVGQKLILPGVKQKPAAEKISGSVKQEENISPGSVPEEKNKQVTEDINVNEEEQGITENTETEKKQGKTEAASENDVELLKKSTGDTEDDVVNDLIGDNESIDKEANEMLNADTGDTDDSSDAAPADKEPEDTSTNNSADNQGADKNIQ